MTARARNLNAGDLIVRSRTSDLLWRVAVAARATQWSPELEDGGDAAHAILDDALDELDAHVRSGGARCSSAAQVAAAQSTKRQPARRAR